MSSTDSGEMWTFTCLSRSPSLNDNPASRTRTLSFLALRTARPTDTRNSGWAIFSSCWVGRPGGGARYGLAWPRKWTISRSSLIITAGEAYSVSTSWSAACSRAIVFSGVNPACKALPGRRPGRCVRPDPDSIQLQVT